MDPIVQVSRKPQAARESQGLRASEPGETSLRRRVRSGTFRAFACIGVLCALTSLLACTHKVQVEAPKEPIVINLNVKIEHEVRIKVDDDLDDLFDEDEELF